MKLAFPVSLKNTEFLEPTATIRSTWAFKLATVALISQTIIVLGLLFLRYDHLPPLVPLWYSKPWGTERLVPPYLLLVPLIGSILIYLTNIATARKYAANHPMFGRVLFLTSALVSLISTVVALRIIVMVT